MATSHDRTARPEQKFPPACSRGPAPLRHDLVTTHADPWGGTLKAWRALPGANPRNSKIMPTPEENQLTPGQGLPAPLCSADRGRWERSEWPHPKFPKNLRPSVLPDVIWIRIHSVFRGAQIEEVTGWQSLPPEAERCENPESSRSLSPVASFSQNTRGQTASTDTEHAN